MKVTINGKEHFFESNIVVKDLLSQLQLDPKTVAIEQNLAIVPCSEHSCTSICEGDNIEIVQFIGGG